MQCLRDIDELHHCRVLGVGGGAEVSGGFIEHEIDALLVLEWCAVEFDEGELVYLALAVFFHLSVDAYSACCKHAAHLFLPFAGGMVNQAGEFHAAACLDLDYKLLMMLNMKQPLLAALPALVLLSASCDPNAGSSSKPVGGESAAPMKEVADVNSSLSGPREIMRAKVDGKDLLAVITWRPYDAAKDAGITKWYGDMGTPPPAFVCDSLIISVDGRGTAIPRSKVGYLCSQWPNNVNKLGLATQGSNLCVYVNVGDGAEGWTASYVVNPATGALVSHQVHDGPAFHNQMQ